MRIKTNDKVQVTTGKDKGKTGKVLQVFVNDKKVVVEGLNLLVKNTRPRKQGEKGQQIKFPAPLNISNVLLICPNCSQPTRVGFKMVEKKATSDKMMSVKQKKYRFCKKCKQTIE